MNKKELASFRKEFKPDSYRLQIGEIYSAYIKKDNKSIIHQELHHFDQLDEEMKELYLKSFKKVITGSIDTKLFELDFENTGYENNTQSILYRMISDAESESLTEGTGAIIEKLMECYSYETDVVLTVIRARYMLNANKKAIDYEEGIDDIIQSYNFVLCSINKIEIPKRALRFDFRHQEFSVNSVNDAMVNMNSPLGGFLFPVLTAGEPDVNKVLYYNAKVKELDRSFIEGVLNCSIKMDAMTEKDTFTTILQTAIGDTIKPDVIQDIYERIGEVAATFDEDAGEVPTIGLPHVRAIIESIGVGNSKELERAFDTYVGTSYDFKVQNILPELDKKSIKIESEKANITLTPRELNSIRQVRDKNGRKCLLIELTEDVVVDGFKLETIEEEV